MNELGIEMKGKCFWMFQKLILYQIFHGKNLKFKKKGYPPTKRDGRFYLQFCEMNEKWWRQSKCQTKLVIL